jgi:polysaccharide biosynthesis transport protein
MGVSRSSPPHQLPPLDHSLQVVQPQIMPPRPDDGDLNYQVPLAGYWYVLLRRRWTIIAVVFIITGLAAIVSFQMKPVYRATARLEIEPETPALQSNTNYQRVDADDTYLLTQIQVLKSNNLAWQIIQEQHLAPDDESNAAQKGQILGRFLSNLKVEIVPKTRMLSVGFESDDPKLAAQVANSLVNNYLDYNFRQKYDAIRRSGWMEQQLSELKTKMEQSQQALVEYQRQHQIVNTGDKQNVLEQMLGDLSRELTAAEANRIQKESVYRQVFENRAELAVLVHDDLLQNLEERTAELKVQLAEALAQYGPKFPKVLRLQSQVGDLQSQIDHERNRVIARIGNDFKAANSREKLATAAVARQKQAVGQMNQLLVQQNVLQHDFETNQQLYQSLLQHLKDATVSAGLRSTNIHVVDEALAPRLPIRPRKMFNILTAFWASLVLGIMFAFAQEMFDSSIKSADEAESLVFTPMLATIPLERKSWLPGGPETRRKHSCQLALSLSKQPKSSLSEAFRVLGTAVCIPDDPPKTLLITSSRNGEGKTTTALNLGQALVQRKGPVVVVDCDLRRGGVSQVLGLKGDRGVTTVLAAKHDPLRVMHHFALHPNLWILPSGPPAENPAELLASPGMATLLKTLADRFAYVIVDSPPALAVTDATILSSLVDGVIIVAATGNTPRSGLIRTHKILASAGARILGITVNKCDGHYQNRDYVYYQ